MLYYYIFNFYDGRVRCMKKEELAKLAVNALKEEYKDAECSLQYKDALQLLIATRLAAQCTDKRVNMVTPTLFAKYKSVQDFAKADVEEVGKIIKSCGFYKVKSKDIVNMCKVLIKEFGGVVPDNMEDLLKLPGIGRKTANLILGDIYGKPAIVVDTHCIRLTKRLGFHNIKNPEKIEKILKEVLPQSESNNFCHRLVLHGRAVCKAGKPLCDICCMKDFCEKNI